MRVDVGHHVGGICNYHGIPPPMPSCVQIVYVHVRKVKLCSTGRVAFRSFAWPTFDVRKATLVARTLWANHRRRAGVLVVRGRCRSPIKAISGPVSYWNICYGIG